MSLFREEHGCVSTRHGIQRLPSASVAAVAVLSLVEQPSISVPEVLRAVQGDPAMVLALLQAAFAQPRTDAYRYAGRSNGWAYRSHCRSV